MFNNIKIAIGIPLSNDYLLYDFFESFYIMKKPYSHVLIRANGYRGVDFMRNQIVQVAKQHNCSHILFLDTDHYHNPETITKLTSHNLPIVSGLNFMRNDPYEPAMFNGCINNYKTIMSWNDEDLIEVDSVGGASLLVKMEVFDKIQYPWFEFIKNPDPNIKFDIGEDVVFCNKAKLAGYKIYVDTSCKNQHIGKIKCDKNLYEKWKIIENNIDK